jgi:hypothetical protein
MVFFFSSYARIVWSSDVSYENHKIIIFSRAPSAHSNNKQQPKEKEEEEEEEETKCRFVVVRRINLPPSLSSLAHLSLGSDSRDGVLVFF